MTLADERARAVVAHMTARGRLEPERVTTKPPAPVDEGESLSVVLDLDALEDD